MILGEKAIDYAKKAAEPEAEHRLSLYRMFRLPLEPADGGAAKPRNRAGVANTSMLPFVVTVPPPSRAW